MPKPLPDICTACDEHITYTRDIDGLWMECACDMGYVA
jgi:hypothetical protein